MKMCVCNHIMESHIQTGKPIPDDYGSCESCDCRQFVMPAEDE